MRPLDLNLASRPFRNNTLVWLAYIALLALAASFTYWNVSSFRHYETELTKLDLIQGNMDQEQSDLIARHKSILRGVRVYDRTSIVRRTSKANQVIQWKAFSWTRLFNQLEELLPYNVRLTSVRPIFRERDRNDGDADPRRSMPITVEGLARDWNAFFELETDLIDNESFGRVLPRHIAKVDNGELSFSIEFQYYPDESSADATIEEVVAGEASSEGDETSTDVASAEDAPRKLPEPNPPAGEVTDEWAGSSQPSEDEPKSAKPTRRALPKVEKETDPSDDEGESR